MSNEVITRETGVPALTFTRDQVELIKRTIAKGTTDDEFALFMYVAKSQGLNPLTKQIHCVKRWDSKLQKEVASFQVGIDGFRLIAERTGRYAPGKEPVFAYDDQGKLVSATATVRKLLADGTWADVSATAFHAEYVQTTKEGKPNSMWAKMPHSQLAKTAEALAIRKAFPNDTSGVRGDEEMEQADNEEAKLVSEPQRASEAKKEPAKAVDGEVVDAEVADQATPSDDAVLVESVEVGKQGTTNGKQWVLWKVVAGGVAYSTFDEKMTNIASRAKEAGQKVIIAGREGKYGLELVSIQISAG